MADLGQLETERQNLLDQINNLRGNLDVLEAVRADELRRVEQANQMQIDNDLEDGELQDGVEDGYEQEEFLDDDHQDQENIQRKLMYSFDKEY